MNIRHLILLPILLISVFSLSATAEPRPSTSSLVFEDAWIAEAPPVSKVLAAYMSISNTGNTDIRLVSAQSKDFGSIEFHRTIDKEGMASMQHQPYLLVPAGGKLILEPGDYHMMLFNPGRKLRAGDESSFQFKLDTGNTINATAIVKKVSTEDSHHHHHH